MRWISRGLIFIIVTTIVLVVYTNRTLYFSSFDVAYWQDKFEHSQWSMPLSIRALGDDGLYLWEGYRLSHGGDPSVINAEAPPFGKYLIGISIKLFGNGYVYGLLSTTAIILLSYGVVFSMTNKRIFALAAAALLSTDPLIAAQFPLTMLDSIQIALLLGSFILLIQHTYRNTAVILSGVALGLFAQTKIPISLPGIFVISIFYLWRKFQKIAPIVWYTIGVSIGYLLPYVPYLLLGHTPLEWLRLQKWMLSFYLHAKAIPTWGSAFTALAIGVSQNIFSRAWGPVSHWSPSWILITLCAITETAFSIKKRHAQGILLGGSMIVIFLTYQAMPFWIRYLVLILPLFYILTISLLVRLPQKYFIIILGIMLTGNCISTIPVLFPTPEATARQVAYNWENMFFQDMYENITAERRSRWTRASYRAFAHDVFFNAEIESIHVDILNTSWQHVAPRQIIKMRVTYFTRHLGSFTETHEVPIVKESGRWRIPWEWEYLMYDLTENRRLQTHVIPARRGSIVGSDNKPIAEDVESAMIWITPAGINRPQEPSMLAYVETLFDGRILSSQFHQRVNGNTIPTMPVLLGVPPHPVSPEQKRMLESFSGILLTPASSRVKYKNDIVTIGDVENSHYFECCTRLYSTTTYDGVSGVELKKNTILKGADGGSLNLVDANGQVVRTILQREMKNGADTQP